MGIWIGLMLLRPCLIWGINVFLGDWKDFVLEENKKGEKMDQEVLVMSKK